MVLGLLFALTLGLNFPDRAGELSFFDEDWTFPVIFRWLSFLVASFHWRLWLFILLLMTSCPLLPGVASTI